MKDNCFTTIKQTKQYMVDFDKVENFADLKNIVQIIFVGFPIRINEGFEYFEDIKEYLVEVN